MNDKITEIEAKLSAITPEWEYNGNEIVSKRNTRCGIGGFLTDEDNEFAASAPEYITYLLQLVETQNEAINEAINEAYRLLCTDTPFGAESVLEDHLSSVRPI